MDFASDSAVPWGVLVAALGGAAVGMERQWSGHASGTTPHFGGIRTLALLGLLAGMAGSFSAHGLAWAGALLVAAGAALVALGYMAVSERDPDATTEVASLVVLAAGFWAGMGQLAAASGVFAGVTLLLVEKSRLHAAVARISAPGLRAAARFAVMALVILPLLPEGPFGPWGGVKPRQLWMLVLFFSSLSFAGYLARGAAGPGRGYAVAGLLGGLVSSTNVTWTFSRLSRQEPGLDRALALGTVAACTLMYLRVAIALAVLAPGFALTLVPLLALPFLPGAVWVAIGLRRPPQAPAEQANGIENPLAVGAALQMAVLFQVVLFVVDGARQWGGGAGLVTSGAILGLTDVDALTVSMAQQAGDAAAGAALIAGIVSNSLVKFGIAAAIGRGRYRLIAGGGLGLLALLTAGSLVLRLRGW